MSINIVIMCYYCYSLPLIFVLSTTGHLYHICGVSATADISATILGDNMSLSIEDQNEREVSVLI